MDVEESLSPSTVAAATTTESAIPRRVLSTLAISVQHAVRAAHAPRLPDAPQDVVPHHVPTLTRLPVRAARDVIQRMQTAPISRIHPGIDQYGKAHPAEDLGDNQYDWAAPATFVETIWSLVANDAMRDWFRRNGKFALSTLKFLDTTTLAKLHSLSLLRAVDGLSQNSVTDHNNDIGTLNHDLASGLLNLLEKDVITDLNTTIIATLKDTPFSALLWGVGRHKVSICAISSTNRIVQRFLKPVELMPCISDSKVGTQFVFQAKSIGDFEFLRSLSKDKTMEFICCFTEEKDDIYGGDTDTVVFEQYPYLSDLSLDYLLAAYILDLVTSKGFGFRKPEAIEVNAVDNGEKSWESFRGSSVFRKWLFPTKKCFERSSGISFMPLPKESMPMTKKQIHAIRDILAENFNNAPYLLLGGSGSGKTYALVEAARLILYSKVNDETELSPLVKRPRLLVITTNFDALNTLMDYYCEQLQPYKLKMVFAESGMWHSGGCSGSDVKHVSLKDGEFGPAGVKTISEADIVFMITTDVKFLWRVGLTNMQIAELKHNAELTTDPSASFKQGTLPFFTHLFIEEAERVSEQLAWDVLSTVTPGLPNSISLQEENLYAIPPKIVLSVTTNYVGYQCARHAVYVSRLMKSPIHCYKQTIESFKFLSNEVEGKNTELYLPATYIGIQRANETSQYSRPQNSTRDPTPSQWRASGEAPQPMEEELTKENRTNDIAPTKSDDTVKFSKDRLEPKNDRPAPVSSSTPWRLSRKSLQPSTEELIEENVADSATVHAKNESAVELLNGAAESQQDSNIRLSIPPGLGISLTAKDSTSEEEGKKKKEEYEQTIDIVEEQKVLDGTASTVVSSEKVQDATAVIFEKVDLDPFTHIDIKYSFQNILMEMANLAKREPANYGALMQGLRSTRIFNNCDIPVVFRHVKKLESGPISYPFDSIQLGFRIIRDDPFYNIEEVRVLTDILCELVEDGANLEDIVIVVPFLKQRAIISKTLGIIGLNIKVYCVADLPPHESDSAWSFPNCVGPDFFKSDRLPEECEGYAEYFGKSKFSGLRRPLVTIVSLVTDSEDMLSQSLGYGRGLLKSSSSSSDTVDNENPFGFASDENAMKRIMRLFGGGLIVVGDVKFCSIEESANLILMGALLEGGKYVSNDESFIYAQSTKSELKALHIDDLELPLEVELSEEEEQLLDQLLKAGKLTKPDKFFQNLEHRFKFTTFREQIASSRKADTLLHEDGSDSDEEVFLIGGRIDDSDSSDGFDI